MLTSDLVMEIRAARRLSSRQAADLARILAGGGADGDHLELLRLIGPYAQRSDPRWAEVVARLTGAGVRKPSRPGQ